MCWFFHLPEQACETSITYITPLLLVLDQCSDILGHHLSKDRVSSPLHFDVHPKTHQPLQVVVYRDVMFPQFIFFMGKKLWKLFEENCWAVCISQHTKALLFHFLELLYNKVGRVASNWRETCINALCCGKHAFSLNHPLLEFFSSNNSSHGVCSIS